MKRLILLSSFIILLFAVINYAASGTPSTLVVRTDANNYLLVTSVTQTNPVTQGVFSSRTLRTDSSGSLQVVLTGTVTPTYPMAVPASTCAAPSLGESGAATTGIAFTATPSILECITGVAVNTITSTIQTATISDSITRGTITTDLPVRTDTVTWNAGGVTFTGWKLNVTNTASAAASLLMDLQVGSVSQFSVNRSGSLTAVGVVQGTSLNVNSSGGQIQLGTRTVITNTAPTVPVACTNPAITNNNGTASALIDVGTTCAGISTLSITLPAATQAWICYAVNTTTSATAAVEMTASTSTSATFTNFTRTTGLALAWADGADIRIGCLGG